MPTTTRQPTLVTGATGFIGRSLIPALVERGHLVRAASRQPHKSVHDAVQWCVCDLQHPETLAPALQDVDVAYYLVHSMGGKESDFRTVERRSAETFAQAASKADVRRIVYLGGPAPAGRPSEHLRSRLEVGEMLRSGPVPTVELRASMVIGPGSASWQIVRDLAMRLPAMVLPKWLKSRTRPLALEDVIVALASAATMPLEDSEWFDLPGPEVLTGREILERIAASRGRRIPIVEVPLLSPQLSAMWLRLVTHADFVVARQLVAGLLHDILPQDETFWKRIGHTDLVPFNVAVQRALAQERPRTGLGPALARLEERLVDRAGRGHRRA